MPDTAELTYELAKRFYAEFVDFRRELASVGAPLATLEPDQASIDGDLAGSNPPPPGEVAPKATEGEDSRRSLVADRPLRQATPATSPWRGG